MEAVLLIGIQGAGKSTFYQRRFFNTHVRLSLDLLKTHRRESVLLEACLATRQPLVIDNMNVTAAGRARYILPARAAGFRVAGYFFEPDPQGSLRRNNEREGKRRVPPAGLFGTLKRLQRPRLEEGFDELFRVRLSDSGEFDVKHWGGAGGEGQSGAD
jgi:predicted kinase